MSDTTITSTISGAAFNNGNSGPAGDTYLSGSFTAVYDDAGNLVSITSVDISDSGNYGGSTTYDTTFEGATITNDNGTYSITLDDPSSANGSNPSAYGTTILDWTSETPSTLDGSSTAEAGSPQVTIHLADGGTIMNTELVSSPGSIVDASTLGADASIDYVGSAVYFGGGTDPNVLSVINLSEGDSVTISTVGFTDGSALVEQPEFNSTQVSSGPIDSFQVADQGGYAINVDVRGVGGAYLTIGSAPGDVELSFVNGNYVLTDVSCFVAGTNVRTPSGDVAVETLKAGDLVTLSDGRTAPISWLGRQTVSTKFADPLRVLPIRIKAHALGESLPARDILISPDHAVLVNDILVQAGALVNGVSILRETDVPETFTYYHVEVGDHSLILAENLAAETFIDNVDRMNFDNWDEHAALDSVAMTEMAYPRAKSARQVPQAIRARLMARAQALYGVEVAAAA